MKNEDSNFDSYELIFQQDGAPLRWSLPVRVFLNNKLPQRWIGRIEAQDIALCAWPLRSPDLTVSDFFSGRLLWIKSLFRHY